MPRPASSTDSTLEWLSLVEVSGAYFAPKVLREVFPQGLPSFDIHPRRRARQAWEEWRDAIRAEDRDMQALHRAWVELVLRDVLGYRSSLLTEVGAEDPTWVHESLESGESVRPDWVVGRRDEAPLLLVSIYPPRADLEAPLPGSLSPSNPLERTTALCRTTGVNLALVTNGEEWTLLSVPMGSVFGLVSWQARLWWQEDLTLRAFHSLLGEHMLFGDPDKTPSRLLERSLEYREEVTATLGEQVERAVEVLVRALDRANRDRGGELLHDVPPTVLYEAGLTVMMRLVFILCAEERGLLLSGDPIWDGFYAVSTLRGQLEEAKQRDTETALEQRYDAWSRLLAVFRAVYGGINHDALRMPALGGSLFDPDRFAFLEGRPAGSSWHDTPSEPLPIDNRTVLLLLSALQKLVQRSGAQTLSYRALDVEQIGQVYEGLLERTVTRVSDPTLGLTGSANLKNPNLSLVRLEQARLDGRGRVLEVLEEATGRPRASLERDLNRAPDDEKRAALSRACENNRPLLERVLPFAALLRTDAWEEPVVYPAAAFVVGRGNDRRETGAHYTPKSLTESIVSTTLEPVVYVGPAEGLPREDWQLKSPAELLELKVCDPAMGSGAFLVQACRYLAERLVESWGKAEADGAALTGEGEVLEALEGRDPLSSEPLERLTMARRLVAERCLYGVDINPMAVELAKLSLWLVTLAKGRPFGFLDHNLRHGNSLLGIHRLEQLTELSMTPKGRPRLFAGNIERAVNEAIALRKALREVPIRDISDVRVMANLDADARRILDGPHRVADALVGEALRHAESPSGLENALRVLDTEAARALDGDDGGIGDVSERARVALGTDMPSGMQTRDTLHWPLEFPEVFVRSNGGFDAFVGNPPFLGGQKITGAMGTAFRNYLVRWVADGQRGSADLVVYFFLSCYDLLREGSGLGFLAVNTIAEGDTRQVGLERLVKQGAILFGAWPNEAWPGKASVVTSRVHLFKGVWAGKKLLSSREVEYISPFLSDEDEWSPRVLASNSGKSFQGVIILGDGFVLDTQEGVDTLMAGEQSSQEVIHAYIGGDDLNSNFNQSASRWVIGFWDWPLDRETVGSWQLGSPKEQKQWLRNGSVPRDFPGKVAADYPRVLAYVEEKVKPERDGNNDRGAREKWWRHLRPRAELFHVMGQGKHFFSHPAGWTGDDPIIARVICCARAATKYPLFELCSTNQIFSDGIGVFTLFDHAHYAMLNSAIHAVWAWKHSSSLETRMRYTPTDCFETFPFPLLERATDLEALGIALETARRRAFEAFDVGLTDLYNLYHDPTKREAELEELRRVHLSVDECFVRALGFDDLDLGYGFHSVDYLPETDRLRFGVSEPARLEILRRLAALNRQRYQEELEAATLPSSSKTKATSSRPKKAAPARASGAAPLFDEEARATFTDFSSAVLDFLRGQSDWLGKDAILDGCGVPSSAWQATITALLESGAVEKQGEKRGGKYRAVS